MTVCEYLFDRIRYLRCPKHLHHKAILPIHPSLVLGIHEVPAIVFEFRSINELDRKRIKLNRFGERNNWIAPVHQRHK